MIKIGITGGIGSGKSVVAELFKLLGVPVYNADQECKRLMDVSPIIREHLTMLFGNELYTSQGLNRRRLADLIFNNAENLHFTNHIVHPEVKRDFLQWTEKNKHSLCAIESAILFESGFEQSVDRILMVYTPLPLRIERARIRDGVSEQAIRSRMQNQLDDEWKREHSDDMIFNDGQQALIPQVMEYIKKMELQAR